MIDTKTKKQARSLCKMSDDGWFVTGGGKRSVRKKFFQANFEGKKKNYKPQQINWN